MSLQVYKKWYWHPITLLLHTEYITECRMCKNSFLFPSTFSSILQWGLLQLLKEAEKQSTVGSIEIQTQNMCFLRKVCVLSPELGQEQALDLSIPAWIHALLRRGQPDSSAGQTPSSAQLSCHWEVSKAVINKSYELIANCSWGQEQCGVQSLLSSAGLLCSLCIAETSRRPKGLSGEHLGLSELLSPNNHLKLQLEEETT